MIHDILAVSLHEDNVRAGIARQNKRDLLKAFRKGNPIARAGKGSQARTSIESQSLDHPVVTQVRPAGW